MAERHLVVQRHVASPPAAVWAVCADFPNLANHWSGLKHSRTIGEQTRGVGARRKVNLKPFGALVETVTAWEDGKTLATSNQPSALVPFTQAEARLTLEADGEGTAMAGMEQPVAYWETADGSAWTGGSKSSIAPSGLAFYTADAIPQWKGSLFTGALAGAALWRLTLSGNAVTGRERLLAERGERIRDVRQGPDGWLYLLTDASPNGKLLRYEAVR